MDSSDVTAECLNCGFPLSPTHSGPCPRCGKVGKRVAVRIVDNLKISDMVTAAVNTSAGTAFAARNIPIPEWWPEAAQEIISNVTKQVMTSIESKIPRILEQHEKVVKARDRSPRSLVKKGFWFILVTIASLILGAIFTRYILSWLHM